MTQITCTRSFHFDTAHRIKNHEGKCKMFHGHRYILEVFFIKKNVYNNLQEEFLDELGRVIDFSQVKKIIKSWIDENFDHNVILAKDDIILGSSIQNITNQKIYYLDNPPTAENIALHLFNLIIPSLLVDTDVRCCKIRLYETPNCFVEIN